MYKLLILINIIGLHHYKERYFFSCLQSLSSPTLPSMPRRNTKGSSDLVTNIRKHPRMGRMEAIATARKNQRESVLGALPHVQVGMMCQRYPTGTDPRSSASDPRRRYTVIEILARCDKGSKFKGYPSRILVRREPESRDDRQFLEDVLTFRPTSSRHRWRTEGVSGPCVEDWRFEATERSRQADKDDCNPWRALCHALGAY